MHAAMFGRVMLCGVGSMFLVDSSLVQLFVSSRLSVLTTYVYSCHTSLTVMPLSVYVCMDLHAVMFAHCEHCIHLMLHNCASVCACVFVCAYMSRSCIVCSCDFVAMLFNVCVCVWGGGGGLCVHVCACVYTCVVHMCELQNCKQVFCCFFGFTRVNGVYLYSLFGFFH